MRETVVAGVGMTPFGRWLKRDLRSLTAEATAAALDDAGMDAPAIQSVFFGNCFAGALGGQDSIRGQVLLRDTGMQGAPIVNVENACASGASAFHLAWLAVASGQVDAAMAIGAEKLYHPEPERSFAALRTAIDVTDVDRIEQRFDSHGAPGARSIFMDIYAEMAREYTKASGATATDYAVVAEKNHAHGALNPLAQYRQPTPREEVLASRTIVDPLTLLMCSPLGDGAAAVVVTTPEIARRSGAAPVRVLSTALSSGIRGEAARAVPAAASRAYELAGLGPSDFDVIELHDATAPAELILYEELGLCGAGEGPKLLADGATMLGGEFPVNTSGGLLSRGHPVGATGTAQLVELVVQLRGRAGDRQVPGARIGLAENSGGFLDPDVAVAAVTILST